MEPLFFPTVPTVVQLYQSKHFVSVIKPGAWGQALILTEDFSARSVNSCFGPRVEFPLGQEWDKIDVGVYTQTHT